MEENILSLTPKKILRKKEKPKSEVKAKKALAQEPVHIPQAPSAVINPLFDSQNEFEQIRRSNQKFKNNFKQIIQQPIIQITPVAAPKPKQVFIAPRNQLQPSIKSQEDQAKLKAQQEQQRIKARNQLEEQLKNKLRNTPKPQPAPQPKPQPFSQPKLLQSKAPTPKPAPKKSQRSYEFEDGNTRTKVNELSIS
jgi:hypothetical protein